MPNIETISVLPDELESTDNDGFDPSKELDELKKLVGLKESKEKKEYDETRINHIKKFIDNIPKKLHSSLFDFANLSYDEGKTISTTEKNKIATALSDYLEASTFESAINKIESDLYLLFSPSFGSYLKNYEKQYNKIRNNYNDKYQLIRGNGFDTELAIDDKEIETDKKQIAKDKQNKEKENKITYSGDTIAFNKVTSIGVRRSSTSTLCSLTARKDSEIIMDISLPRGNAFDAMVMVPSPQDKYMGSMKFDESTQDNKYVDYAQKSSSFDYATFSREAESNLNDPNFADVYVEGVSRSGKKYGHRCTAYKVYDEKSQNFERYVLDPYRNGANNNRNKLYPMKKYQKNNKIVQTHLYKGKQIKKNLKTLS